MFNLLRSPDAARVGSALLVIVVAALVGRQAALGLEPQQWLGAAAAILGSIALAALVHTAPDAEQAKAKSKSRD